ncbi:molybdate ABC transporter substrate-binding protein [Amycolatopsis suaedae]|uniref:Molybdate ABC transporter substrate-binding protein n=1 Tax=Amycolatopsis suaedae TaxID=2510978 RepID=A0A4Q7J724_9PSEU|nr:molybdate ABC transporter substrate-binding protein [Amycolatopsis suaedae]RZQ61814.1 molybdate ABC transporter substrate-binding protein [Amycolatopsis suaedae]
MRKLLLVALLALTACSGQAGHSTLTVFAAASLTESFTALEKRFEAEHTGVDVVFSFAGSSQLAQQINEGARADVFASADEANMNKVTAHLAGLPAVFATNQLTIAVAPGNPKGIRGLADLARPGLAVVVCAPQVPCGAATRKAAGTALKPVSEEQDVKAVLTKVTAGEADAGLVYRTDVRSAGEKVTGVDFPEAAQAVNRYPIAALAESAQAEAARQFTEFVLGPAGREELTRVGFGAP